MRYRIASALVICLAIAGCSNTDPSVQITAFFEDVGDLPVRAGVQSADVSIGKVSSIELQGYTAKVTMQIAKDARLPQDSLALIRSTSLLGEKFIELLPPEGGGRGRLSDGDSIPKSRTGKAPALDDVLRKLGRVLQGGSLSELGPLLRSAADIVRGKQVEIGRSIDELKVLTGTLAPHSADLGAAIVNLDTAFAALTSEPGVISSAVSSSADAAEILANQQKNIDRLLVSLDGFSSVTARYAADTVTSSDRALDQLRLVLDEVMKTTDDLDKSLIALAHFTDLWPRAIPGDYIQLDVVNAGNNVGPSAAASKTTAPGKDNKTLSDLLWSPIR